MSFQMHKIITYAQSIKDLPNVVHGKAEWLKARFDMRTDKEVKEKHNGLIDALDTREKEVDGALSVRYTKTECDTKIAEKVKDIGAGDMSKIVYDKNNNGKVDSAELADNAKKVDEISDAVAIYTVATDYANLSSGENAKTAFGKIAKAVQGVIGIIGGNVKAAKAGYADNAGIAVTAGTCTGNAATVGDNSTLAYGGAITTTPWLAAWEGKKVRCIAPTDVTVGNAEHFKGFDAGVSDTEAYLILQKNGKHYKYTDAIRAVVAEVCTGHAALDAYIPVMISGQLSSVGPDGTCSIRFAYPAGFTSQNTVVMCIYRSNGGNYEQIPYMTAEIGTEISIKVDSIFARNQVRVALMMAKAL